MISNISFLLPQYARQNRNMSDFSLANYEKSPICDCFIYNNKLAKTNKVSFKGSPEGLKTIGYAALVNKNNSKEEKIAEIKTDYKQNDAYKNYFVYLGDKKLGEMTTISRFGEDYGILKEHNKRDFVFIDNLDTTCNDTEYKGVGSALIQTAIEESFKQKSGGRVQVKASRIGNHGSPVVFYYNLDFRSCNPSILKDTKIEEKLSEPNNGKKKYFGLKNVDMYLPEEGIDKWKEKIAETPILKEADDED